MADKIDSIFDLEGLKHEENEVIKMLEEVQAKWQEILAAIKKDVSDLKHEFTDLKNQ